MQVEKHDNHYYKILIAGKIFWIASHNLDDFRDNYPQLLHSRAGGIITYK
jgi:hypothetical protein